MLPTRQGSNPQPPNHQSDTHPIEPPRPAYREMISILSGLKKHLFWSYDEFFHCSSKLDTFRNTERQMLRQFWILIWHSSIYGTSLDVWISTVASSVGSVITAGALLVGGSSFTILAVFPTLGDDPVPPRPRRSFLNLSQRITYQESCKRILIT